MVGQRRRRWPSIKTTLDQYQAYTQRYALYAILYSQRRMIDRYLSTTSHTSGPIWIIKIRLFLHRSVFFSRRGTEVAHVKNQSVNWKPGWFDKVKCQLPSWYYVYGKRIIVSVVPSYFISRRLVLMFGLCRKRCTKIKQTLGQVLAKKTLLYQWYIVSFNFLVFIGIFTINTV